MRIDLRAKLFIGFKLEGRLRYTYESSDHREAGAEAVAPLLTEIEVDGKIYLGKVVDGGLATDRIDDVTRHVLSILKRVLQGERLPTALSIFPVTE
jgi:hypothetical protein